MLTFHRIIAACEQGDAGAWRAFLADYTPLAFELIRIYAPSNEAPIEFWRELLATLLAGDFKLLRGFEHNSEREFLIDLRACLFEKNAAALEAAGEAAESRDFTPERVSELLKGMPLLHQEILFLKLAGYSDARLEEIFRITPSVAQHSLERLAPEGWPARESDRDACPHPGAWMRLQRQLRAARTDQCPSVRQFIRIQDGQVGWHEKEPAERRLAECLHCLENWTALKEIGYWRRAARDVPAAEIDRLFSGLPLAAQPRKAQPLFKRIFG